MFWLEVGPRSERVHGGRGSLGLQATLLLASERCPLYRDRLTGLCPFSNKCSLGTDTSSHPRRLPAGRPAWTPEGGCQARGWDEPPTPGCVVARMPVRPPHTSEAALTARGPDRAFPRRGACRVSSLHRHLGPSPGRRAKLQRPQVGARAEALVSWAQNPLICWQPQRAQSEETGTSVET